MRAADNLLDALPPITFVVGKGGVGKTTCAAALALRASRSRGTLLVTTDPARALPSVLDAPVDTDARDVSWAPGLAARVLDAATLRDAFLARWRPVLALILDRGTYLDAADIAPLVDTALPGGDEIFAALELARLCAGRERASGRLVVDTAPTGHTLRLLALPRSFRALVALLDAMQDKHRFLVRTLTRSYRADDADAFLVEMRRQVDALESTLRDPARCAAVLVANAQPVVIAESRRLVASLRELGIAVPAVVWNGESTPGALGVEHNVAVPRLDESPVGKRGLTAWLDAMQPPRPREAAPRTRAPRERPAAMGSRSAGGASGDALPAVDWLPALTIVAGKGGVGKTTVAAALAVLAAADGPTLIVSTDPAPSLGDAFDQAIPDTDTPVAGVPGLHARQMDAPAAFERVRRDYAARVDALFASIMGSGVRLDRDHAIIRELLALAPPGVDEVYALTLLAEALAPERYRRVIVDPAPTGHLLRLLEMPRLALAWTHQLMRLMLRYKDVAGLGETAAELLDFARQLRTVDALLRDPASTTLVLVTLDEPVVAAESRRLARAVAERGVTVGATVLNRASPRASLPTDAATVQVVAPTMAPPPVGPSAVRRFASAWRLVPPQPPATA